MLLVDWVKQFLLNQIFISSFFLSFSDFFPLDLSIHSFMYSFKKHLPIYVSFNAMHYVRPQITKMNKSVFLKDLYVNGKKKNPNMQVKT